MSPLVVPPPADSAGVIGATTGWLRDLLLGELAYMLAVLAIALVGAAMLQGRLSLRHAARVVLGCFILFGAPVIANGLSGLVQAGGPSLPLTTAPLAPPPLPRVPEPPTPNPDPYAGASVPM
jgi:type IV secretion system protein VirB2